MRIDLQLLKSEFAGKTNHQAYELAFAKRLMRPDPNQPGTFLGNTQRQEFLPSLLAAIDCLPPSCEVFDIGAGKGDAIDLVLNRLNGATINLLEPNAAMLGQCRERLAAHGNLREGLVYCGKLQDYYLSSGAPRPEKKQDLILAIHMLYHITDFHDTDANPYEDIEKAFCTMYDFLTPGGVLFHVVSDQVSSSTGQASRYYFGKVGQHQVADRINKIALARKQLLLDGDILPMLDRHFPRSNPSLEAFTTNSYLYGGGAEDIAAMCITAEIGVIDNAPFDLKKLEICAAFVEANQQNIGLTVEGRDIPQKGMIRSNQPQIVSLIRKAK